MLMTQDTTQIPALPALEPDHPGTILREEFLEPYRAEVKETAAQIGVSRHTLHRVLAGKSSVTAEMALRLERLTGASAPFWLNLQAQHDLWHQSRSLAPELKVIRGLGVAPPPRRPVVVKAAAAKRSTVRAAAKRPSGRKRS